MICFSSNVDESSKSLVFSWWDNLANKPGGEVLAWFTFFFFGVVSFDNNCAVATRNGDDDDDDNDGDDDDKDDDDDGNDNDDKNGDDDDNSNDTVFGRFVSAAFLDSPFLTFFVGVTIEGDGLRLLAVLASGGVRFLFVFAMVG